MIRLLVSNRRGGVGKTTTTVTYARYLADMSKPILLMDIDPQGSLEQVLGIKAQQHLAHFVAHRFAYRDRESRELAEALLADPEATDQDRELARQVLANSADKM